MVQRAQTEKDRLALDSPPSVALVPSRYFPEHLDYSPLRAVPSFLHGRKSLADGQASSRFGISER